MSVWEAHVDDGTKAIYYYNNDTGETTWTKPDGYNNLSKWEKILDPSTNRHYYANTDTGEVQWTKPSDFEEPAPGKKQPSKQEEEEEEEEEEDPAVVRARRLRALYDSSLASANEEAPSSEPAAPDQCVWEKLHDDNTDHDYYVNSVTNAVQWECPPEYTAWMAKHAKGDSSAEEKTEEQRKAEVEAFMEDEAWRAQQREELARQMSSVPVDDNTDGGDSGTPGKLKDPRPPSTRKKPLPMPKAEEKKDDNAAAPSKPGDHRVLDAPLRADIAQFKMAGFAEEHFRCCKKNRGLMARKVPVAKMLSWQKELIDQSLLSSSKSVNSLAVKMFRLLQECMGDRESKKGSSLIAKTIIQNGDNNPAVRDEIFCQIVKQIKNNPDQKSTCLGWKLLIMCASAFPPTRGFQKFLLGYCADHFNALGEIKELAPFAYWRIHKTCQEGPAKAVYTLETIDRMIKTGVSSHMVSYHGSIDYILKLQHQEGNESNVPEIVSTLCKTIKDEGGFSAKGIFRIAAHRHEVETAIDAWCENRWKPKAGDHHTPADMLKIWLRDLEEPLFPTALYPECLAASSPQEACMAVAKKLPASHFATLDSLMRFLSELSQHVAVTSMDAENLAIVFSCDILRTDETDPQVLYVNSPKEKNFIRNLILCWTPTGPVQV